MKLAGELIEGVRIAGSAIRANKLRSSLATLGIVIGIVTVTLMGTAIAGLNGAFLRSISSLGTDVLHVSRFSWFMNSYAEYLKVQNRQEITLAQVKAVEDQLTLASAVAPYTEWRAPVRYKKRSSQSVTVVGTTDKFLQTGGVNVALGRFLMDTEVAGGRPLCVLGSQVASNLFLNDSPLGKSIRLGEFVFEVIGVLEQQGEFPWPVQPRQPGGHSGQADDGVLFELAVRLDSGEGHQPGTAGGIEGRVARGVAENPPCATGRGG